MRNQRFVAVHRGGLLELGDHALLSLWAADCAEHVLTLFEAHEEDCRPRCAIEVARAWARGEVTVGEARKASVAAHAAAREASCVEATAAARAAGHAVATAHMADHSLGAAYYAVKAVSAAGMEPDSERRWQIAQCPDDIRDLVLDGLVKRFHTVWPLV